MTAITAPQALRRLFEGETLMFKFAGKVLSLTAASLMVTTAIVSAQPSAELVAAAKAEGQLTTIALPHDWCGYGEVIDGFKKKYPEITINELNPDAGSATRSRRSRPTRTTRARRRRT
jgi:hypothetical protein